MRIPSISSQIRFKQQEEPKKNDSLLNSAAMVVGLGTLAVTGIVLIRKNRTSKLTQQTKNEPGALEEAAARVKNIVNDCQNFIKKLTSNKDSDSMLGNFNEAFKTMFAFNKIFTTISKGKKNITEFFGKIKNYTKSLFS